MSNHTIQVISFGYKYATPPAAHFVLDVRCLPNPYWNPDLQPMHGETDPIQAFFQNEPLVQDFLNQTKQYVTHWLSLEKKPKDFVLAIGCTGGMHRSVYMATQIAAHLVETGYLASIEHREEAQW